MPTATANNTQLSHSPPREKGSQRTQRDHTQNKLQNTHYDDKCLNLKSQGAPEPCLRGPVDRRNCGGLPGGSNLEDKSCADGGTEGALT